MPVSRGSFNHLTKLDLRHMHNKMAFNIERAVENSLQKGPLSELLIYPFKIMEIKPAFNSGLDDREVGGNIKVSWREK